MLTRKNTRKYLMNFGDLLMVALSFLAANVLAKRHAGMASAFPGLEGWELFLMLYFFVAWNAGARVSELYGGTNLRSPLGEETALGQNIILQAFLGVFVLFLAKSQAYSRFFLLAYFVVLLGSLSIWRFVVWFFFAWRQRNGHNLSHILIIGGGQLALSFAETVNAGRRLGYRVKGFVADMPHPGMGGLHLGRIDGLAAVLEAGGIDEVVVVLPPDCGSDVDRAIATCERYPMPVRIVSPYPGFMSGRFRISRFGPFPLYSVRVVPLEQAHWRLLKRGFDLLAALAAFVFVFSWLWPLLGLLIKATSAGPIFFKQERWGEKNRPIQFYKFRSMVAGSRDLDANGNYSQATRNDPRVTRFGRFLRRSNLDELPQFINVLKGEMSLVGPRPHPTPMNLEAKDSIRNYQWRHMIKPGITGWAQVNGLRGDASDPAILCRRVELDIWYIENWTFWLDLRILWLSLLAMFKGDPHAY